MTESQKIRLTQIADIVAEQQNISLPEGERPEGLERIAYVLEHAAGIAPVGGKTALSRVLACFNSGKVIISNEAETPVSLAVKTMPTKTSYVVGETLDTAGLSLTLTYSTGDVRTLTSGFTLDTTTLSEVGTKTVAATYVEGDTTLNCTFTVTVAANTVQSLTITGTLTNPQYVSTAPDITGLTATATYLRGNTADVTESVVVTPATYGETAGTEELTISYTEEGVTVSNTMEVTVEVAPVEEPVVEG